jgi:hypothetical protein
VGDCGIELLGLLQLGDAFLGLAGAQEGEAVIHVFAGGIGGEVEGLLELVNGLRLGGGVLVESLAEIAEATDAVLFDARCVGAEEQDQRSD